MTFKISIDPTTELGKHLSKYTPRQRNNQLIELATIGLTRLGQVDPSPAPSQSIQEKPFPATLSETQSSLLETASQQNRLPRDQGVDFGDDLLLHE